MLKNGSLLRKGSREGASINPRALGCFQVYIRCHRDALNGAALSHDRKWKGPELVPRPGVRNTHVFCRRTLYVLLQERRHKIPVRLFLPLRKSISKFFPGLAERLNIHLFALCRNVKSHSQHHIGSQGAAILNQRRFVFRL